MLGIIPCDAAETLDFTWKGNYNDMMLEITINTPVKYNQSVSVVMFPNDTSNPSVNNYNRMLQTELTGGKSKTVRLPIADDLYSSDGKCTVVIQGSGYQSSISRKVNSEVYVLTPSQINGESGLISEFNRANSSTIAASLVKVKEPLALSTVESAEETQRYNEFFNIRTNDFSNSFITLDDVKMAWECSDVLVCLKDTGVTASELKTAVELSASLLGIVTTGDEYDVLKEQIYEKMIKIATNKGLSNIKSASDVKTNFVQATAVAAINNASMETIETEIKEHATGLGISNSYIEKFDSIKSSEDKNIVTRQLQGKGFNLPSEASKIFSDAVDAVLAKETTPDGGTDNGDDGDSGSGGGGGGGGGKLPSVGIETIPSENKQPDTTGYADCRSGHWAFEYIDKLTKLGVVNGYDNGMFYPDKKVTREEFVKMIMSATGLYNIEATCSFGDVSEQAWYYRYIASAVQSGIISGISSEEFGTGKNITREDAAVIAARSLKKLSKYPSFETNITSFNDASLISSYASESVAALSGMNIINGYEDGSFKPQDNLTRAQAAKIISLIIE